MERERNKANLIAKGRQSTLHSAKVAVSNSNPYHVNKMQRNLGAATVYTLSPPSPATDNRHHNPTGLSAGHQHSHSPLKSEPDYFTDEEDQVNARLSLEPSDDVDEPHQVNNFSANNQQYQKNGNSVGSGGSETASVHSDANMNGTPQRSSSIAASVQNASLTSWHQPVQLARQQQQSQNDQHNNVPHNAYGMLTHDTQVLYITESCTEIGRNSSTSSVHFHVAKNSFVSRKHLKIIFNQAGDFFLICLSKNGVFIDHMFQRRSTEAIKLPRDGCTFRFPSTEIRIVFESFVHKFQANSDEGRDANVGVRGNFKAVENSNVILSPLKITIPKTEQKSPYPSPTGTISAANSCPTSPRGYQEYPSYHYNNNNNFQNGLLPPPPAATGSNNEHEKPPYSYAQLIVQSISAAPDKQLTLSGIYSFISKHYPYYRKEANKGWQNSIRHNLSLNRYFIKVARSQDEPGKGSFWRIDPNSEAKLIDQSYKKRRQRGQFFRPTYGMPRSAPVSPSHIDNSRDNSPLRDIVLQSAPGSPGVSYQTNHNDNHGNAEDNNYSTQHSMQSSCPIQFSNSSSTNNYYASGTTTSNNQQSGSLKRHQTSTLVYGGGGNSGGGNISSANNICAINETESNPGIAISTSVQHRDIYDDMPEYSASGAESADECESSKRHKYGPADE